MINDNNGTASLLPATGSALCRGKVALREEECVMVCDWTFFRQPEAPLKHYDVTLRIDTCSQFWSKSVENTMTWMCQATKLEPCHVPASAEEPLY